MLNQRKFLFCQLISLLLLAQNSIGIYDPNDQFRDQKPAYTSGIKTAYSRPSTSQVQLHHNYSRVYHQNYDGSSGNYYNREETFRRPYPVYHQQAQNERLTYVLNGTRIRKAENPVRRIVIYNKEKRTPKIQIYKTCPYNATGQFVYESSCNQFLNCWRGRGYVQNCSPGTLFNPKTLECDFPDKVDCITGPRRDVLEREKSHLTVKQIGCPKEFSGLIPNYTDCSKFINCVSGIENFMDCPAGTLFDVDKNICDFAHKANCFNGENHNIKEQNVDGKLDFGSTRCEGSACSRRPQSLTYKSNEIRCPPGADGLHKHPTDCSKFLNCDRGQTYVQDCAPGTLFNPIIKICDFPYNVRCQSDRQDGTWQQHKGRTDVPAYVPSGGGTSGGRGDGWGTHHYDDQDDYYDTTTYGHSRDYGTSTGYGGGTGYNVARQDHYPKSTTSTYYYNRDTGNRGIHETPIYHRPNQEIPRGTTGTYYYNNQDTAGGFNRAPSEPPVYQRPVQSTNNYGSGTTYYNRPGGTYDHQPNYNNYDQNVYGNTYGQSSTPQYTNNLGQNQYDPYDEWGQRPSSTTYDNRPRDPYGYNQQTNQYHWNQPQYGQSSTVGTYQNPYGTHYNTGTSTYPGSGGVNYNNRKDGRYGTTYNRTSTYGQDGYPVYDHHQGSNNYNYNRNYDPSRTSTYNPQYNQYLSNNYYKNISGYGTYNGSRVHQEPTYHQQDNRGTVVNHRGESGYNQNWYHSGGSTNREPITPNYEHVVNINQVHVTTPYRKPYEPFFGTTSRKPYGTTLKSSRPVDYDDTFTGGRSTTPMVATTQRVERSWPPPFPSTDLNADYVFEYDDDNVSLEAENAVVEGKQRGECTKSEFRCALDSCISKTLVCNGARDCPNGNDELKCLEYVSKFSVRKDHKLAILEKERWDNVSIATCALLCIETRKFQCRSFNYRKIDKTCFLADSNEGMSGALIAYYPFDYYELNSERIDCSKMYVCNNKKCIDRRRLCDGNDDCGDRMDEKGCKPEDFGYEVKLTGSGQRNQGRIEVTAFGKTGYVCDDNFGMRDADVVCRELGFEMGAVEVKKNSFFAENSAVKEPFFMMDDVTCFGNETRLMDCDFSGWGVHNCLGQEIAGVVCKTPQEKCQEDYWQCDDAKECLPLAFVCDGLLDCTDGSDEKKHYCEAPTEVRLVNGTSRAEGRVEIKHSGIWGTICDDDFNEDAAKVICKQLGYKGSASVRKEGYFGAGTGPIWLDQVFCSGNESNLESCTHWDWGEHNCEHSEDVGIVCSNVYESERHSLISVPEIPQTYPSRCGYRNDNIFNRNDDVHFRVVKGSVAKKGDYPWQAAIRVKGKATKAASHWCGAVIISERFILTAAHCLMGYPKGAYVIVAGDYDVDETEGTEQQVYIEDYYVHEKFRQGHKMNNDIALVKLKGRGFRFDDDVQPICLPDAETDYETSLNCTVSGFGSVQSGRSAFSHQLRAGWIPIQKKEICKMPHVYGDAMTDGMVCAGTLDEGIDACDGDSGGPLACLKDGVFTLYGITSWGQHCGYANKPGVYVKVAHYRKWIDDNFQKYSST